MPDDGRSTRARLVDAARQLFLVQGYEATSVSAIVSEAGVHSGSLYHFFKTKEALLLAVLDWYLAMLYPEVLEPVFSRTGDAIGRVFGVLDGYRQMLSMTHCRMGCPIGNLALEMSEKSEPVRAKIAQNLENWRVALRQCLIEAGDRLPSEIDRDKLATFILTVMEGGVMQARAYRSLKPFEDSVAVVRDYFERLATHPENPANPGENPRGPQ
jgi:AcrR family transcriptional regulator